MKNFFAISALLFATTGFAQEMNYDCKPVAPLKKAISVSGDQLVSIERLTTNIDSKDLNPTFTLSGKYFSEVQIVNHRDNEKLELENFADKFVVNEPRAGMVLDLKPASDSANALRFLYTILSMHSFEVDTAGPVPEGTWNQKVDLILITDGAVVNKINFNCKVDVKY